MVEAMVAGIIALLIMAPVAILAFLALLFLPLRLMGIRVRTMLKEITHAEAHLIGLFSIACAIVVYAIFGRTI